jgi:L-glyceraldehyde 3-phosphate reductase
MTSALIGASRPDQITEIVGALSNTSFSEEELKEIDVYAEDAGVNLWAKSSAG